MQIKLPSNIKKNSYKWIVTILSGFFIFLVLFVYRAYHIDKTPSLTGHSVFFRSLSHAIITSLSFYFVEFHLSPRLAIEKKIKPFVTALIATLIGLNFSFLTFNYFYQWTELYWTSYWPFLYEYPLIIAFPVTLSILIDHFLSHFHNSSNSLIVIISNNQKQRFQINIENLLYIKSADNYIEIFYLSSRQVNMHLMRKNLKDIEDEFGSHQPLMRCHRSYIINSDNIDHVNRRNNKVEVCIVGEVIPVSKKYAGLLEDKFPQLFTTY
ncbi:LytTR family DNA-binding domain-containing protein [Aquimarina sp. Aq78]|uniref:LytR/AlgR family response regulator transcription factor n=1 Tax=Aquimarina sp. Aq78 TaxID=1191889 RepID=UPI000D10DBCA|nr:LytTR family DNA-binding domain-containing protein [Aquimarina sp. Aq78]